MNKAASKPKARETEPFLQTQVTQLGELLYIEGRLELALESAARATRKRRASQR